MRRTITARLARKLCHKEPLAAAGTLETSNTTGPMPGNAPARLLEREGHASGILRCPPRQALGGHDPMNGGDP